MLSEREAELDTLRAKSHMHHVKTTGAMRALTEDLKVRPVTEHTMIRLTVSCG